MANKKPKQILEFSSPSGLSFGDLVLKDSELSLNQIFEVKTESVSKPIPTPKRNYRHEAELLMEDFFNGRERNFGFTKPIGGRKI